MFNLTEKYVCRFSGQCKVESSQSWSYCLTFRCALLIFSMSSAAMTAVGELRQMRRSLHIEQGSGVGLYNLTRDSEEKYSSV